MKSKKLLVVLTVVAMIAVFFVVMSVVFSVKDVDCKFHSFTGKQIVATDNQPTADQVLTLVGGKNIVSLSKQEFLAKVNLAFTEWHAFAVVKNFPNILDVHFVKRVPVAQLDINAETVCVDSFGFVVAKPTDESLVDITSAFDHFDVENCQLGAQLTFKDNSSNLRLKKVLCALTASWQCMLEFDEIPQALGEANVFLFDQENNMTINTRLGAKIVVNFVDDEFSAAMIDKIIDAFSIYYNHPELQKSGVVITIHKNGKITTPSAN